MSIINSGNSVKTFDVTLQAMKQLIAKDLNVPAEELTIHYEIGSISSDPMDRSPPINSVIKIKVTHKPTK